MDWLSDPQIWAGLLTLTALEIVLGIDNLVFIAVLVGRVKGERQALARKLGLALALVTRLMLLGGITWFAKLTEPVLVIAAHTLSWRDVIMIGGGLFLLYKGTSEIHTRLEGDGYATTEAPGRTGLAGAILQIAWLDVVFSLDSVITAVGMVSHLPIMIAAVVIAVAVMVLGGECNHSVCRTPSDGKDAGVLVLGADRHDIDRRWLRHACAQGLHLRGHQLLGRCGDTQPVCQPAAAGTGCTKLMEPTLHKEPDEPEPRDERSAFAASAASAAAPCAAIIRLDGAAAGEMGSHAPGMRADCRRHAGISSRAWLLDAPHRRPSDRRGHSAGQARHAARAGESDALVGRAAYARLTARQLAHIHAVPLHRGSFGVSRCVPPTAARADCDLILAGYRSKTLRVHKTHRTATSARQNASRPAKSRGDIGNRNGKLASHRCHVPAERLNAAKRGRCLMCRTFGARFRLLGEDQDARLGPVER